MTAMNTRGTLIIYQAREPTNDHASQMTGNDPSRVRGSRPEACKQFSHTIRLDAEETARGRPPPYPVVKRAGRDTRWATRRNT